MTRKRKTSIATLVGGYAPRTLGKVKPQVGKLIVCAECGKSGGSLIKQDEGRYAHAEVEKCKLLRRI